MPDPVTTTPPASTEPTKAPDLAPRGIPWPQAFEEIKAERDVIKTKLKEMDAELAKFRAAEDARKAEQAKLDEQNQRKTLEEQGKYREALEQTDKKWQAQLQTYKSNVTSKLLPLAIQTAAAKIPNLTVEALRDLPKLLSDSIAVDEQTLEVYVKGEDGEPMVDEKLNQVNIDKFLTRFVSERPYLLVDGMPVRHGQAAGKGNSAMSYDQVVNDPKAQKEWEAIDPEGFRKAEQEYWSPLAATKRAKGKFNK